MFSSKKGESQMEMYHFVTKWFFNAPIERLWKEIEDVESWPTWSKDFKRAVIRGPEPKVQVGSVIDCEVRGDLPYTLRMLLTITALKPPGLMEFTSTGDLAGGGKWVLEPRDAGTAVTEHWDVGMTNPIFDLVSRLPFVKAMMEKNHNDVMDRAYRGLKSRVEG
jgi:hypothetical protein